MFGHIFTYLKAKAGEEKGVTIIEYVLMVVLIALAVAVARPDIVGAVVGVFTDIIAELNLRGAGGAG